LPELRLRDRGDLRNCRADIGAGLEKILTTATPFSDCDSMCSMSLTVVVSERSWMEMMRFAMSSGERPV
jgi:hypothetical protein